MTREETKAALDGFLSTLPRERGIEDFVVECDETNNTADTIDARELHVSVRMMPDEWRTVTQMTIDPEGRVVAGSMTHVRQARIGDTWFRVEGDRLMEAMETVVTRGTVLSSELEEAGE